MARVTAKAARLLGGDSADGVGELILAENLHGFLGELERHAHGLLDGFPHGGNLSRRAADRSALCSAGELLQKAARLMLPERGVVPATGEQVVVTALLDDGPGLQDDEPVHAA